MNIKEYIKALNEQFSTGQAREHSYRPALQQLLSEFLSDFIVTNEPARIECGAPDYIITDKKTSQPVFFIEAKDLNDADLDGNNIHKEQFNRYKNSLENIIFTDYLDFHLYRNGEWIKNYRLASVQGSKIQASQTAEKDFNELVEIIASAHPHKITSANQLAKQMAAKARMLADIINKVLDAKEVDGQLWGELEAFKRVLIHDLEPKEFADIYAQTIAYGMFAARLHDDTEEDFSRQEAATLIPKTNPFLRKIFQSIAGFDVDDRIAWVIDDLAATFLATDLQTVMSSYGEDALHNDPMIHFYEDFLSEYDPDLRKSKGVWYTPQPVVDFIVRSVDEILQNDFNLSKGLADNSKINHEVINDQYSARKGESRTLTKSMHRVQILDPATGTGTFLAAVLRKIYEKFEGKKGAWPNYVQEHLLPRLNGFEILMASYAIAHLKLDMILEQTGYVHKSNERLNIFLTNSLEECDPDTGTLFSQWLSDEARAANSLKRDCPVMVMIGNPPYSVSSQNNGEWINRLVADYKQNLDERNIQPLNDDYIKFLRLGQKYIEKTGEGILGFITNNSFLDGIIHREMRHQLLKAYDKIYILNLHGNARREEIAADGSNDENVFDIMAGVSINLFIKKKTCSDELADLYYADLYGDRQSKYDYLDAANLSTIKWQQLDYQAPYYFFVPKDFDCKDEYETGFAIDDLFANNTSGVKTHHDADLVSQNPFNSEFNKDYAYRPFDNIYIDYDLTKVVRHRYAIMKHVLDHNNLCLNVCRQSAINKWEHVLVSRIIIDICYVSGRTKESSYCFPLYLYNDDGFVPNLDSEIWAKINESLGKESTPEEIFYYIYAVLHSPKYRERYKEFLKIDFPRVPYPESAEEFIRLVGLGRQLTDLHLMTNAVNWETGVNYNIPGDNKVDKYAWKDNQVWINKEQYFENVPQSAWEFFIGGYQPAQKWLKDRKGQTLSFDDIDHYCHIIYALQETQRLMNEIDSEE